MYLVNKKFRAQCLLGARVAVLLSRCLTPPASTPQTAINTGITNERNTRLSCGRRVEPLYHQQLRSLHLKPQAKSLLVSKGKFSVFQFTGIYIYRDFPHQENLIIDHITLIQVDKGGEGSVATKVVALLGHPISSANLTYFDHKASNCATG